MHLRRSLALACAASAFLPALPAFGDDLNAAAELFDRGTQHLEAKRYAQACPLLAESYRLDPQLGALFTLAECEAKRGRSATALARYEEYLTLYAKLPPAKKARQGDRESIARAQVKALTAEVSQLVVMLPAGAAPETVVKLDGAEVAADRLGAALPVDPGEHEITTQAPGGVETKTRVTLEKREKKQVLADVQRAPAASAPVTILGPAPESAAPESASPGWKPYALWGGVGLGVVGIGAGIGLTVAANAKNGEVAAEVDRLALQTPPSSVICPLKEKDPRCTTLTGLVRTQNTYAGAAIAGFAVGGIAVAGALVSVLLKPSGPTPEAPDPSRILFVPSLRGMMVMGSF